MNKKLIFRILGALASALIIVAVFVPFVNVTGYTTSLWEIFEITDSLYLPIMIIVFGAIGVILFAINIKTELAYMSTGAISFFAVMQTIDIVNQGVFNTLSIGYYFLIIGAFLTGLMAFLINLKSTKKEAELVPVMQPENNMLNQIDNLNNNTPNLEQQNIEPIQINNNVVEPIPVQPVPTVEPVDEFNQSIPDVIQPVEQHQQEITVEPIVEPVPIVNNPVIQEFQQPNQNLQPNYNELNLNNLGSQTQNTMESIQTNTQTIEQPNVDLMVNQQPINPVVQEFQQPNQNLESQIEAQQFLNQQIQNNQIPNNPTNETTINVDIFGQPIDK